MDPMPQPAHARPARRDHLWVLAVIAICALFEVWVSWVTIGSMSGFPKIGGARGLPTAWTLAVTSEAYWGYALYAWLAGAPGPRSRRFAMWSFAVVFVLSLIGQAASHLVPQGTVPPPEVVVFITSLPVIVLALIAVLVHLRQLDREESAEAEQQDMKAGEIAALRAELATEREALQPLRDALAGAQREAEEGAANRAILERKLAAQTPPRKRANAPRAKSASARAKQAQEKDVDARTKALDVLAAEPGISGAELGPRVGMSKRWGQLHKPELVAMAADLEQ
jgi:hypothetical protein